MKCTLALSLVFLSVASGYPQDKIPRWETYLLVGATGADAASTIASRGRELNPILGQNRIRQMSIMSASTAVTIWSTRHLRKSGRPGLGRILLWTAIGAHAFAAGWNIRQMRNH